MPKTCCSCRNAGEGYYEQSGDSCLWGGPCLNGWKPIVGAQLLAMCGMFFSVATLADCSFAELGKRMFFPEDMDEDLPLEVTQTQYVGFLTWKKLDGSCYWYTSGSNWEDQLATFHEMLGYDWEKSFYTAAISATLSVVFFCYVLSFTCSSQVRGVRYFNAVFLCVIITTLQGITFVTFSSSLCDEYGCTFSRSAGFSAAAMLCFFSSGLFFFGTTNYRGPKWNGERPALVPMKSVQVAPDHHSKDFSMQFSEEMQYSDVIEHDAQSFGSSDSDNVDIEEVMPDYDEEEIIEEEIVDDESGDENGVENGDNDRDENVVDGQDEEEVVENGVEAQVDAAEPAEPTETQEPEEEPQETQVQEGTEESKDEEAETEHSDVALDNAASSALEATTESDTNVEEKEEQIASDETETANATETETAATTETGDDAVAAAPPAPAATDDDDAVTAYTEITIDDSQR